MSNSKQNEENELYLDVQASQIKIALLRNKKLIELNYEKSNTKFAVGDIYLGKVKKLMPGLNAAFIDIGYKKDAFLHYLDLGPNFQSLSKFLHMGLSSKHRKIKVNKIHQEPEIDKNGKIQDVLQVGQYILVQVAKEPISNKGPRLSSEISLAGRNIVLMPFSNKVSISQKISTKEERARLKNLIESIIPENYGAIIRTVAEKKMVSELDKELSVLVKKWENLYKSIANTKPPKLLLGEENRATVILRDILNSSFSKIVVNNKETYQEIKEFILEIAPEKQKIVKLYNKEEPIFDHFGIEKQIKTSFGKTVPMKNGAYLIIEHTEAAHVIDVNSGTKSNAEDNQENNALSVNLIAAEEIARQLKLRDMGGIIIIDFIDMVENDNKKLLFEKMKEFMEEERAKFHIAPLSRFCLMEITRQRVRPELEISTNEGCPCCKGTGKVSASIGLLDQINNSINFVIKKHKVNKIVLKTHPFVHAYLTKGLITIRKKWQKQFKCKIVIKPMMSYTYMEYKIFNLNEEELF